MLEPFAFTSVHRMGFRLLFDRIFRAAK